MKDMFSEAIPQNINWMSIEGDEKHELLLLVQMVDSVVGIWSLLSKNPSQPAANGSGPGENNTCSNVSRMPTVLEGWCQASELRENTYQFFLIT
jgi:hypothetical protein